MSQKSKQPILVVLESPYAGKNDDATEANLTYCRLCMNDSIRRGEAPFAGHLLYTQPGILNDKNPAERKLGMEIAFLWARHAKVSVVYLDYGLSGGMIAGIKRAREEGRPVEYRILFGIMSDDFVPQIELAVLSGKPMDLAEINMRLINRPS